MHEVVCFGGAVRGRRARSWKPSLSARARRLPRGSNAMMEAENEVNHRSDEVEESVNCR